MTKTQITNKLNLNDYGPYSHDKNINIAADVKKVMLQYCLRVCVFNLKY